MTYLHYRNSRSEHLGMTWLNYITDTSQNKHRGTIHKKSSEYISKLQLHQHSLLTRKAFSRHNLTAQVFFFVSYGSSSSYHHLHLQVIFHHWIWIITRSGSSSLDLDHHSIWNIITGSGSSLNLYHHHWICIITWSGPSLLDHHHWIWIITGLSSLVLSLDSFRHRKFYRVIPFSCWL